MTGHVIIMRKSRVAGCVDPSEVPISYRHNFKSTTKNYIDNHTQKVPRKKSKTPNDSITPIVSSESQ